MKKINDYKELSPIIMRYFKRGVITNNFLTKADYVSEISEGNLFYEEEENSLCLYLLRDSFYILYFYALSPSAVFSNQDKPIICDAVGCEEILKANGFKEILTRVQLVREADEITDCEGRPATKTDAQKVYELMKSSFNDQTGYVPTYHQMLSECSENLIWVYTAGSDIAGVLRLEKSKGATTIRHLCVAPEYQRQGIGKKLCKCAFQDGKKSIVWTGKENNSAILLYKSSGFVLSGMESCVYRKDVKND